jgi:hypothetical protein
MTTLCTQPFCSQLFNEIPHVDTLDHSIVHEDRLPALKAIIKEFDLLDCVAITLTHKHIDVNEDEIIVGSFAVDKIIMNWESKVGTEDFVPFQFVYNSASGWMPVAFWNPTSAGYAESILPKFAKVEAVAGPFFEKMAQALRGVTTGGFAAYGISLIFQQLVDDSNTGLLETTDSKAKNQWFRKVPENVDANYNTMSTIWYWLKNPEDGAEDQCRVVCNYHQWTSEHRSNHQYLP